MLAVAARGLQKVVAHERSALVRCFSALPPHTKVTMPSLSPTMKAGTIAKWLKKEGDVLKPGDALADVETDKATMAFEFTEDALLAKILRPEGSTEVAVGDVIAITVEDAKDVAAFKDYKLEAAPAAAPAPAALKPAEAPKPAAAAAPVAAKPAAPAAAPAPKPAAAPAAPAAPAVAAPGGDVPYLSFDAWGTSLKRAPIGAALARQQNAYAAMFGYTGFDPLPLPEEAGAKKEKPAAAAAAK